MRSAIPRIAEAVLALGIIALLVTLAVPWRERPLPRPAAAGTSLAAPAVATSAETPSPGTPDSILPIFVGRPAVRAPAPAQVTPAKPPVDATWLRYVGRSRAPDGSVTFFLKDTRTGKLISAGKDEGVNGWTIVEEKDASLLLKSAGILYSVIKK